MTLHQETYPLLAIAVLQVIAMGVIPVYAKSEQEQWQEPVLGKDNKVGEEATHGLHHSCNNNKDE